MATVTNTHGVAAADHETPFAARLVHASKIYGKGGTEVRALDDVSVEFERARLTSIMGPSGSGKSTLVHCLAGLDDLTSGEVFVGDANLSTMNERERTRLRRDHIGFVFQAYNLVATLDAAENISLPRLLAGERADGPLFDQVVEKFHLHDRLRHRPAELSGGQQQRVAVARALVSRPDLVFADEPTGNLDSKNGAEILRFLREAVDEFGQTIVMVTHDPVAASYSDRVIFLADGRVVHEMRDPTPDRILDFLKTLGG